MAMTEETHEILKEIRIFIKNNFLTYNELLEYIENNDKEEWKKALDKRGVAKRIATYCRYIKRKVYE